MREFFKLACASRHRRIAAGTIMAVNLLYSIAHVILLREAGGDWNYIAANVVADPGKHFFGVLLFPVCVVVFLWLVETTTSRSTRTAERVMLAIAAATVAVSVWAAIDDHARAYRYSGTAVPVAGEGHPCYISDLSAHEVRSRLVQFDEWARELGEKDPSVSLRGFKYYRTAKLKRENSEESEEIDLVQAYVGLFHGTIEMPDELRGDSVEFRRVSTTATAQHFPDGSSLCGVLGPVTSAMATAAFAAFFMWLVWMYLRPPPGELHPAVVSGITAVFALFAVWIVLGTLSQTYLKYFEPTSIGPEVAASLILVASTFFVVNVTKLDWKVPEWVRLVIGDAIGVAIIVDVMLLKGENIARVGSSVFTVSLAFKILMCIALLAVSGAIVLRSPVRPHEPSSSGTAHPSDQQVRQSAEEPNAQHARPDAIDDSRRGADGS